MCVRAGVGGVALVCPEVLLLLPNFIQSGRATSNELHPVGSAMPNHIAWFAQSERKHQLVCTPAQLPPRLGGDAWRSFATKKIQRRDTDFAKDRICCCMRLPERATLWLAAEAASPHSKMSSSKPSSHRAER